MKNGTPSVGGFIGHAYGVRVLRIDRPDGRRVLKFDGPSGRGLRIACGHAFGVRVDGASPRGLWPPNGGGLYSLRSGGDSACGAEGGGLPQSGNAYKVSVTELAL